MSDVKHCATCKFWLRLTPVHPSGECRAKSPRAEFLGRGYSWPSTTETEWCGEQKDRIKVIKKNTKKNKSVADVLKTIKHI